MSRRRMIALAIVVAAATLVAEGGSQSPQARGELMVAAAASLSDVAAKLVQPFRAATGIELRFNFAGSNTLARQIIEGARADVFFSADEAQMDVVEKAGRLEPGTRIDVLSNQLVIIVPSSASVAVTRPEDLTLATVRRVAMGDPAAVPVGVYGRRWLENLQLWTVVAPKVVPLPTSTAALAAVRAGRAQAGIVYATDARTGDGAGVRVAYVVQTGAPAIAYPAAAIRRGRVDAARKFLEFLRGPTARRLFEDVGFRVLTTS